MTPERRAQARAPRKFVFLSKLLLRPLSPVLWEWRRYCPVSLPIFTREVLMRLSKSWALVPCLPGLPRRKDPRVPVVDATLRRAKTEDRHCSDGLPDRSNFRVSDWRLYHTNAGSQRALGRPLWRLVGFHHCSFLLSPETRTSTTPSLIFPPPEDQANTLNTCPYKFCFVSLIGCFLCSPRSNLFLLS